MTRISIDIFVIANSQETLPNSKFYKNCNIYDAEMRHMKWTYPWVKSHTVVERMVEVLSQFHSILLAVIKNSAKIYLVL